MADNKKQLGTLVLENAQVLRSIKEVNEALKGLGEGANLDLTKIVETKVSKALAKITGDIKKMTGEAKTETSQLESMIKQTAAVTETWSGKTGEKVKTVVSGFDEAGRAVTEYKDKLGQVTQATVRYATEEQQQRKESAKVQELLIKTVENRRKEAQKIELADAKAANKAQEDAWKESQKAMTKAAEEAARQRKQAYTDGLVDIIEEIRKFPTIEEETNRERKFYYDMDVAEYEQAQNEKVVATIEAREREADFLQRVEQQNEMMRNKELQEEQRIAHIERQIAFDTYMERVRAQEKEVAAATENYRQQLELRKRLASLPESKVHSAEAAELQRQLEEKQNAFAQYSAAIQEQVMADKSLIQGENEIQLEIAKQADAKRKAAQDSANKFGERIVSRVGMAEIRLLREQWNAAVEYASTYYDKLNEIRVVTGKTEQEAEQIGASYRKLAKEMKVTSTELSQAAVKFYRQGLNDAQVNKRLESVTKYAKIANIEFDTAAELVTAATNSMDVDVDRVIDVFMRLGDSAATSGEEVGKAMQKAAASASTFGVDFEWLATWITTVSEKLRTAPETIGNAFNTMMARMHSIKQKGYNDEDTTKINDVAKALKSVGIELMNQSGQWNEMDDLYEEIANKWGKMDDKQKAYIATTMAGTRQQNVFYALMNDMAKGIEGGSRAWELYEQAMNAAGTATQKYAVWQESVSASQENMNRALEDLYANLQPTLIKGWYDVVADIVDLIARGTDHLNGMNIVIPLVISGVGALTLALIKANGALGLMHGIMTAMNAHPIIAAVTAFIAIAGAVSAVAGAIETSSDRFEKAEKAYTEASESAETLKNKQETLISSFVKLSSKTELTNDEQAEYKRLLEEISGISATAKKAVDDFTGGLKNQADVIAAINEELEEQIRLQKALAVSSAREMQKNYSSDGFETESSNSSGNYTTRHYNQVLDILANIAGNEFPQEKNFSSPKDYFDALTEKIKKYRKEIENYIFDNYDINSQPYYMLTGVLNDIIGKGAKDVFDVYLPQNDAYEKEFQEKFSEQVNELIGYAITGADLDIDQIEEGYLTKKLYERFIGYGEDGLLEGWEVDEIVSTLQKQMNDWIKNGYESGVEEMTDDEYLKYLVRGIFSKKTFDSIKNELNIAGESGDLTESITEFLEKLVAEGFTNAEIEEMLKDIPVAKWATFMREKIDEAFGEKLSLDDIYWDTNGDWESIDYKTEKIIYDLINLGTSVEDIKKAFDTSGSLDEFKEKLKNIGKEATSAGDGIETTATAVKQLTPLEKIKEYQEAYSKYTSIIESLEKNKSLSKSDLSWIMENHPGLMDSVDDLDALTAALKRWRDTAEQQEAQAIKEYYSKTRNGLLGFRDYLKKNGRDESLINSFIAENRDATLSDLITEAMVKKLPGSENAEIYTELYKEIWDYLNKIADSAIAATKEVEKLAEVSENAKHKYYFDRAESVVASGDRDALASYMENVYGLGNVDLLNRGNMEIRNMQLFNGDGHSYNLQITPTLPNGETLDEDALQSYISELAESGDPLEADKIENGGKGLLLWVNEFTEDAAGAGEAAESFKKGLEAQLEAYYDSKAGLDEYAQSIRESFTLGEASANNYRDQVAAISSALKTGGIEGAVDEWNKLDKKMQEAIAQRFPSLVKKLDDAARATAGSKTEMAALKKELSSITFTAGAQTFTNTAKAIEQLRNNEINAADAMAAFNKEAEAAAQAQYEFYMANENMAKGVEVTSDQVQNLAEFLGYLNPDVMLDNWDQVGPMIANALAEGEDAFRRLNEAAFINITGTSEADFSAIQNGIITTIGLTEEMIELLQKSGQWEVETIDLQQMAWVFENGRWVQRMFNGMQQVLKPTGNNPFTRKHTNYAAKNNKSSGGSNSGRSNKNSDNTSSTGNQITEVERMLDVMDQIQKFQGYTKDMYAAMAKYYEGTGELQGVIAYLELEKQALADVNATLEANVKDIEAQMAAKQAEIAGMAASGEAYETVAGDLEKLQSAHQNYTKQLISNKSEMDSLTKAIKKQQDTIRDMEINLRQTIYKAIEDREALIERKLQGRITLENEILGLIQKRYERERDMILENADKQIEALQKERDLLSEQLQLRREQKEEEDKAAKLRELEEKYQRIVTDPTRRKEALDIQSQITDLREEMAWDLAEKEVEAQQRGIDEQITSIEDYAQYVKDYYEDLFSHPKKLIAEMQEIISQTDEYIIEWLKANTEEYANVTAARQTDMVNKWEQMLLDMHGELKLYWDEVEDIIAQGDEAIINFLINNSADYKKAGKLQAEAYVDQWVEQLKNLALAHKQVTASMVQSTYTVIQKATSAANAMASAATGRTGGSYGGSGGLQSNVSTLGTGGTSVGWGTYSHYYTLSFDGKNYTADRDANGNPFASRGEAYAAGEALRNKLLANLAAQGVAEYGLKSAKDMSKLIAYKGGGMADFTGPAWLDGTKQNPEAILNAPQTKLFQQLVEAMDQIARVRVSGIPAFGSIETSGNAVNVGDIILNIEKLETDEDYDDIAERVFERITNRINRGAPIGGIRF